MALASQQNKTHHDERVEYGSALPTLERFTLSMRLSAKKAEPTTPVTASLSMTPKQEKIRLWNKILGITATALIFTTSLIGDKNVLDTFANRLPSQSLLSAHHGLIIASSVAYLATNIMAWFDPLHFKKPALRFWFNLMRWVHTIGFVALIALGIVNARLTPGATTGKLIASIAHMSVGYITLGALGVGTLLLFF